MVQDVAQDNYNLVLEVEGSYSWAEQPDSSNWVWMVEVEAAVVEEVVEGEVKDNCRSQGAVMAVEEEVAAVEEVAVMAVASEELELAKDNCTLQETVVLKKMVVVVVLMMMVVVVTGLAKDNCTLQEMEEVMEEVTELKMDRLLLVVMGELAKDCYMW